MSTSKRITINAASAIIQVAFTAVLYFFLYKYLLNAIGIKQLGVWSLILSFSSIANLANFGITSGLVKFVAEYLIEDDKTKVGKLIFTSIITMSILFSIVSLLVFWAAHYFLHLVIDKEFLDIALVILPFSLVSLSINAVAGVFTSVLEGYQKNYLRNFIYIISGILMYVLVLTLAPTYHLKGVAIAQACQAVFILLIAVILTYRLSPYNRFSHWKWSKNSFNELFNYGYKFQIVSIAQLLYEPTTKILLSKFGGLALLGHYEMATRLVNQFRALLVNANQVVVPVIAENAVSKSKTEVKEFFRKMNRILLFFTLPSSTLLIVITPIISIIWIGSLNYEFIFAVLVLMLASEINILCGPSYFSCMGEGHLSILIKTHIGMAVVNLILGYVLGWIWGGNGIIIAWGLALSAGSIYLIWSYSKIISINYIRIFGSNDKLLMAITILISVLWILLMFFNKLQFSNLTIILISCGAILFYIPVIFKNDNFARITSLLKKKQL